jgi:hypothetical protein
MIRFDHLKLVARDSRELARFRRRVLGGQPGDLERVVVLHEPDNSCCRREPWNRTAERIIGALEPATPQVLVNLNQAGE